jgi:hypothetical protein
MTTAIAAATQSVFPSHSGIAELSHNERLIFGVAATWRQRCNFG